MITSLSVVVPEKARGIRKISEKLKGDKVRVAIKQARGVAVKQITYVCRSGKICIARLDRAMGEQGGRLLCCENLDFPKESGYKRFYSPTFPSRMCSNMAVYVLSRCEKPEKLSVGIYDPDAISCGLAGCVLKYTADVCIVTDNETVFHAELNEVAERTGACALVTHNREQLGRCDLIIAPSAIEEELPVKTSAVVLTGEKPKTNVGGLVYFRYFFRMPNGFRDLKPNDLSEEYFCSALYTLAGQYELGSIVPSMCTGDTEAQTVKSLCGYFNGQ